jgi:hypothetical protein
MSAREFIERLDDYLDAKEALRQHRRRVMGPGELLRQVGRMEERLDMDKERLIDTLERIVATP